MTRERPTDRGRSRWSFARTLLACLAVALVSTIVVYRPDRPAPAIRPGSSAGPAFTVQVIRPRMGLPMGGIVPPGWFGVDAALRFDQGSAGATVVAAAPDRLELRAEGWSVTIVVAADGTIARGTEAVFPLIFEERERRVRCRIGDPAVGSFTVETLADGSLAGRFDLELARCEDAGTGKALGWPPKPFVLHGSFDRVPATEAH